MYFSSTLLVFGEIKGKQHHGPVISLCDSNVTDTRKKQLVNKIQHVFAIACDKFSNKL